MVPCCAPLVALIAPLAEQPAKRVPAPAWIAAVAAIQSGPEPAVVQQRCLRFFGQLQARVGLRDREINCLSRSSVSLAQPREPSHSADDRDFATSVLLGGKQCGQLT